LRAPVDPGTGAGEQNRRTVVTLGLMVLE